MNNDLIACVGDDFKVRVYNYHTTQKIYEFCEHRDFVRKIAYSPTTNELVTCSDDKRVLIYSFDKLANNYKLKLELKEHNHFVMDLKMNPNELGTFATSSMDSTIKLWNLNSTKSNGTLQNVHVKGVNTISFYEGDKPLLLSGGDDLMVVVWDLTTRTALQ